jgi:hypothetical protein
MISTYIAKSQKPSRVLSFKGNLVDISFSGLVEIDNVDRVPSNDLLTQHHRPIVRQTSVRIEKSISIANQRSGVTVLAFSRFSRVA